jgi:site-specific recombinase XerD
MPKDLSYLPQKYTNGLKTYWRIQTGRTLEGRPVYQSFKTDYKAALVFGNAERLKAATARNLGIEEISGQSAADVRYAFEKLAEIGVGLKECVDTFIEQNYPESAVTVKRACSILLKHKAEMVEASTLTNYERLCSSFEDYFGDKLLHKVTTKDLEEFLESSGRYWGRNTKAPAIRLLRTFFKWWRDRGFLSRTSINASEVLTMPKAEKRTPKLAKPEEVQEMLWTYVFEAKKNEDGNGANGRSILGVLFYLVMILFGGARRKEAAQMTWANVNLKKNQVRIPVEIAKTGRPRVIPLEGNLKQWVLWLAKKNAYLQDYSDWKPAAGREHPALRKITYRQRMYRESFSKNGKPVPEIVKTENQERDDEPDKKLVKYQGIMRHSFVSYHLELHNNPKKTARMAGHSVKKQEEVYEELVESHEDSLAWFNICPPEKVKDEEVLEKEVETLEEAVELGRRIEFLMTTNPTEESAKELASNLEKLRVWMIVGNNLKKLEKYREENDSDFQRFKREAFLRSIMKTDFKRSPEAQKENHDIGS